MGRMLKILCLHGYRQNADKFRIQTGGVRKFLKQHAEFIFISAPHLLKNEEGEQRGWWFTKPDSFSSKDETDQDTGFEESLNLIQETFKNSGPFDGILGFSQGAALTALLCALKERNEINIDFKFVVIISGFQSKCTKHSKYYSDKILIPSLHVMGETDEVINKALSEDLAKMFVDSVIMTHSGGHCVPTSSSLKQNYRDFIISHKELCLE